MINSMTGYGNSRFNLNGMNCLIEVRSINHRYLDIKLKTTDNLDEEVIGPPPPPVEEIKEEVFEYFVAVEQQPEPIGGIAAILAKLKYPEIARKAGIEGQAVICRFTIVSCDERDHIS